MKLALRGLRKQALRDREEQLEQIGTAVITHLKSLKGTDLEPGEAIEWKGVEIDVTIIPCCPAISNLLSLD